MITCMAVLYKHTQIGRISLLLAFFIIAAEIGLYFWLASTMPQDIDKSFLLAVFAASVVVVVFAAVFTSTMTVIVTSNKLCFSMGFGVFRKTIPLKQISDTRPVKNKWWHGWGIHYIPKVGTLYNISGMRSVEINLKDGKNLRIGSDQPCLLSSTIKSAIASLDTDSQPDM